MQILRETKTPANTAKKEARNNNEITKKQAHNTHNPKVGGSNPSSATKYRFYRHSEPLFKTLKLNLN